MTIRIVLLFLVSGVLLFAEGCKKEPTVRRQPAEGSSPARAAVKLAVLVVEDPELAAGLKLLRGEWSERSGGQMEVDGAATEDLLTAEHLPADLVVFPSRYLGALVARDALRAVRTSVLESETFARNDLLPLVRNRVLRYGDKVFALPLGESPLLLAGSAIDLPQTWKQLDQLQPKIEVAPQLEHPHAVEFLVRALGYASSRGRSAILFDPDNMQPRIHSAPFVRALTEVVQLKERSRTGKSEAVLTITPPRISAVASERDRPLRLTALPGVEEVYNYSREIWEPLEASGSPVVLGFSGRAIGVTRSSHNASSAFQLLQWLASGKNGAQLSQRSKGAVWFRTSQISQAPEWLTGQPISDAATEVITRQLSAEDCFLLPRIPAIDD